MDIHYDAGPACASAGAEKPYVMARAEEGL
jgi:hypothetical protein